MKILRRSSRFASLALALAATLISGAAAPSQSISDSGQAVLVPTESEPRTAYLDVDIVRDGTAYPELTVDFPLQNDRYASQAMSDAFSCPSADWQRDSDTEQGESALTAECRLNSSMGWFQTSGHIDLWSIEQILSRRGVSRLYVNVYADNTGFIDCGPPPSESIALKDGNECNRIFESWGARRDVFDYSYGYRASSLIRIGAVLALVLLFPIPLTLWLGRQAMQAPEEAKETISFAYLRYQTWGLMGGLILWWAAIDVLGADQVVSFLIGNAVDASTGLSFIVPWFGLWTPPLLVYVFANSLSGPIHRLRGSERTQGEIVRQSLWTGGTLIIPLFFLCAGIALFAYSPRASMLCFMGWAMAVVVGKRGTSRASGIEPHALTTGELRDRVFALAQKAHVKLNQLYVVPTQRIRMANAFAHPKQNVLLTDYLLRNLSKREVDAVVGHEVAHLQLGHTHKRLIIYVAELGAYMAAFAYLQSRLPQRFPTGPACILVALLGIYFVSRRHEFSADAQSVKLTGDPDAMITSLVKISRLNTMPIHWHRLNDQALTHPSTMRRIFAIAKTGGIAPERIPQLIAEAAVSPTETYPLPTTVTPMGKVFSTRFKHNVQNFCAWASLISFSVVPAMFALVLVLAHLQGERLWIAYVVAFLIALAISLITADRISMHGHASLARDIRRKATNEGAPSEIRGGLFVGLGPDTTPRIYENNWSWDVGLLALTSDRFIYWGEEARFSLSRAQITRIALGRGPANWYRTPSVYISWKGADGTEKTFNLRPANANSLSEMGKLTRTLGRDLDSWHTGRAAEPDPLICAQGTSLDELALAAPAFAQVSSQSIRSLVTRRTIFATCFWVGAVAFGVAVIFGLHFTPAAGVDIGNLPGQIAPPPAGWYVLFSAWLLSAIQLVPCLWRREPRPRKLHINPVGSVPAQS
jgi:Zn-dependent protease with chaperone function